MSEPVPITLDQLRVFVTVAEEGSFTAAAKRLHRVQSAVSYAVANLETLLEVQLFDRRRRKPTLTEAGRALLDEARSIDLRVQDFAARARRFARE